MSETSQPPGADQVEDLKAYIRELERRLRESEDNLQAVVEAQIDAVLSSAHTIPLLLRQAQQALQQNKEELEKRVAERTAELQEANCRLEQELEERRRVEAQLFQYAEELKRSNRDLEQFAFFASHDLIEPLRKIKSFSELLRLRAGDRLEEPENEYIHRMIDATRRMQEMIDDLLDYSRIDRRQAPFVPVELTQVAAEIVTDMEASIHQVKATVEIRDLPVVLGDPVQIRQLLQNLISNAIKFHRPDIPPLVHIWAEQPPEPEASGEKICLVVQDNGIGFEEKHINKVFQPFVRLHGRSEFEGTGIGLAICQRIAERHGGKITAQSTPGAGSTFRVILPRQPERS